MAATVTVNDLLDGHVRLDVQCLDRIYLNGYVPNLQVGGQVVAFMTRHLGYRSRRRRSWRRSAPGSVRTSREFAEDHRIPVVSFKKGDRKIDVMRRHLDAQAAPAGPGSPRSGWPRNSRTCSPRTEHRGNNGIPWFSFTKADRRVTCFYFYLWDTDFGPAFIKICAYFPYPIKVWVNGHEWAKRQATHGRDRVHRAVQWVRHLRRSRGVCSRSATGSARAPSGCSSNAG